MLILCTLLLDETVLFKNVTLFCCLTVSAKVSLQVIEMTIPDCPQQPMLLWIEVLFTVQHCCVQCYHFPSIRIIMIVIG